MSVNKAPLLLLPGMMCDARLYAPQIAAFSAERSIHVAALHGQTSMQALAEQVLAQAPKTFALAGLSMGGILAMEVIRQAPERVTRLALLDTNPLAELDAVKALREPQIEKAQQGQLAEVMQTQMIPRYFADPEASAGLAALCLDMALALGPEVFVQQSLALRDRPDQSDTLRATRMPTLILCGEQDALCPPERHALMQSLMPHARWIQIPDAGHLPTLEQAEATNRALRQWLDTDAV